MEHIEEAGIHSGDSACALPPITLGRAESSRSGQPPRQSPKVSACEVCSTSSSRSTGDVLFVLEANPRASRTVPFVSKATGVPLAKAAARIVVGESIAELRARGSAARQGTAPSCPSDAPIAVKEAVMPFGRFHGVDTVLGPEMRSTGEVMGIDADFGTAFAKSQSGAYSSGLPMSGRAIITVANRDKRSMIFPVKRLADLGFEILATQGTADVLRRNGVTVTVLRKHARGDRPERGTDHRGQHPGR